MSAMKNRFTDGEFNEAMALCASISSARDEYREEMYRLREINDAVLKVLAMWSHDGALQTFEDRERFRSVARAVIARAE